jgi:hypothetical protein
MKVCGNRMKIRRFREHRRRRGAEKKNSNRRATGGV